MKGGWKGAGLGIVAVAVYGWFLNATDVSLTRLLRGIPWMGDFIRRMVPPDLSVLGSALAGALQTLQIAVVGTTVAALLALPLGFLSARNVAPGPIFYPARSLLNLFRSVDTMVYALFFVAAVGLGPFPGVLAVVTYTTMTLAKLYSEAIEGIEPGPAEAIAATGASRLQVLCCIGWNRTSVRLRSWGSWEPAGSASTSRPTCGWSTTRRLRPCCWCWC